MKDAQQQLNQAAIVANVVALFVSTDHMDLKEICIASYPVNYHFYPAALAATFKFVPFFACLGIANVIWPFHHTIYQSEE